MKKAELISRLQSLMKLIFRPENLTVSLTAGGTAALFRPDRGSEQAETGSLYRTGAKGQLPVGARAEE